MTDEKTPPPPVIAMLPLQLLARLPFRVLYGLSSLSFVFLYFIVRYRRKVVDRNLFESFPGATPKQLSDCRRKFYRNFCDYIFETIKLLHISDSEMKSRMTFTGVDEIDRYLKEGRTVVAYFSHCGNWEWAPSITLWSRLVPNRDAAFCQIYRPLKNTTMDRVMLHLRSRFGSVSLPKNVAFLDLLRYRKKGLPTVTGFMSDQKPSHGDPGYITTFLNHPTALITGTETVARRLNAVVVYWDISKPSRGHYHIDIKLITESPGEMPEGEITRLYSTLLEQTITREPSIWLWSHKRWKHPVTLPENNQNSN